MILQLVLIAALLLAALWRTSSYLRRSASARSAGASLTTGLYLLALGQILSLPLITARVDDFLTLGVGKTAYNLTTMLGLVLLLAFFTSATSTGRRTKNGAITAHVIAFGFTAVTLIALMIGTSTGQRAHSLHSSALSQPTIAFFYIVGNVYFVYAYCVIARLVWRYSKERSDDVSRLMFASLRVMAVAAAGQALTAVARGAWVVNAVCGRARLQEYELIIWNVSNASLIIFVIGASMLGLAGLLRALKRSRQRRHQYRELEPLWAALRDAHPELVLIDRSGTRFQRRIIECFDGLTRVSPYLAHAASGTDLTSCSESELAGYIRQALILKAELGDQAVLEPVKRLLPLSLIESDDGVLKLVTLAGAFRGELSAVRLR
ncbi:hypothetical protein LWC35_14640 [Pseudonocardia kujensis]|uniref:MAB_1171c family putative transporter n=1 Tax=Pseudonocardia kujensis TaxID=1128675 RepID=UPI001E4B9E9D|nr:MAB_1171c family putative transporter [Pseudonocardia kujensis]MCE0764139.1 hypothetical protein [Pseudonocardia kujensis]